MKKILSGACAVMALAGTAMIVHSCGIYSFSGTSIQPDVYTVTINYFEYKALRVNPSLSNELTEALKDQFRRLTRLEEVDQEGDLEISGEITGYDVKAMAVTADEVAAQNRLNISPTGNIPRMISRSRSLPTPTMIPAIPLMPWSPSCVRRSSINSSRIYSMLRWPTGRIWADSRN